jgi:hypothetical protein
METKTDTQVWCYNKQCKHCFGGIVDMDGKFGICTLQEILIDQDGKCRLFEELGNNAEEIPNYPDDPNDTDDEDYDTSQLCHERQVS